MTFESYYVSPSIRLKLIPPPAVTMKTIAQDVAYEHGLTLEQLQGRSQEHRIAHPRQEAYWRCYEIRRANGERRYSTPQIGRFFGRDHSSVIYGIRQHSKRLADAMRPAA